VPTAELVGGRIELATQYNEKEMVKEVPGSRWDTDNRTWWLPLSWASCVQLRGVFGGDLQIGSNLGEWSRNEISSRIAPCLELRTAEEAEDLAGVLTRLHPFQRAGVKFLSIAKNALLGDDMGLGKTAQAIATIEISDAYPALIVCPNSMKYGWQDEFAKWAPGRKVQVIHGSAAVRRKQIAAIQEGEADVGVINWEGLRAHTKLSGYGSIALDEKDREPKELNEVPWKAVIADEAHKAKDPRSKQTRALWAVGADAEYRFALTGTPIANSPEDLWALMRFVSPKEFPAKTKFIDRYALQSWNVFGFMAVTGIRPDTSAELFRILDPRFIRRTKEAVMPQLPPKTYQTRYVEMGTAQKKVYEQMRKDMLAELDGGILLATNSLTKATRLLQFASCSGKMQGEQLVLTAPSCKVDALLEIVEELGDQQMIVFAESRQLIELAATALVRDGIKAVQVTGAVPAFERQQNVEAFQSGEARVILVTLGAGGEGLTLTAASVEVFLQRSWSSVKNSQAEDRAYGRLNDAHGVTIIDVVTLDSIESRVHDVVREKADIMEEICRDEETLRTWLKK
jgi:SNF2 family DNA or RNA helicase